MWLARPWFLVTFYALLAGLLPQPSLQNVNTRINRTELPPGVYCCEINETKLWKKTFHGVRPEYSVALQPLYDYDFLLPNAQLRAGLSYYGSGSRLRRAVANLHEGRQPFKVGVIGGSISWGLTAKRRGVDDWFPTFARYLKKAFKANVTARNGCHCGTPSSYMELCLQNSVDQDVDLVFVEYSYNDREVDLLLDNRVVKTMERLVRRLLDLPRRPAVVLMQVPHVLKNMYEAFYATCEDLEVALAAYYGITVLSSRTALWQLAVLHPEPGWSWLEVYHSHHPGNPGHKAMADLAVHMIQRTALDLIVRPMTDAERAIAAGQLPAPMYPDNLPPSTPQCVVGSDFLTLVAAVDGFQWVNEGTDEKPKWGYVSTTPGSSLLVRVNTISARLHNASASVEVIFHFLQSYTPMGIASMECVAGCACERGEIDAWAPDFHATQTHAAGLTVTQAPQCEIRITVLNRTRSEGHKFKVSGLVLSDLAKARSKTDYWYWTGGTE